MTKDDEKLFALLANDGEERVRLLRKYAEAAPDHPAVREQRILDQQTAPLLERINKLQEQVDQVAHTDRYAAERQRMRSHPYNFSDKKIAELEERMTRAAKEEGVVFSSYAHAADYIRRQDMPLGPSTAALGFNLGVQPTGGQEKWRQTLESSDPKVNLAMMSRRDRKREVRKLAKEAADEYKANLGG